MKGKKKTKNYDDIMNNIDLGGYGGEDMDDGMANFEKNFNPEKQFDMPIYENIDKEMDKFSKMLGGGDEPDLSSANKGDKESEEDKILKAILGGDVNVKKKKNNDMEELSKALKLAETNLNKKHSVNNDAEMLKNILGGGNSNKKKKDDGMDELNSILSAADRNLKNKDKNDMELVKKFLTKEELGEAKGENIGPKKEPPTKKPEVVKKPPSQAPSNNENDLYPLQQEKIFHRINKMVSLTVLEKEIKLCKLIIDYKKKNQLDYKDWESKIEMAQKQLDTIKSNVEDGKMDFDAYKKTIEDELTYEQTLLSVYFQKDQMSTPAQKEIIKKRINDRIVIIYKEINNEMEDEEEEQEQEKEKEEGGEKEENIGDENNSTNQNEKANNTQSNDDKIKLYVDLLLQQYLSAKDYFGEHELKEQQKDSIDKCKQIIMAKKKILAGNTKEVNLNELPKSIKPEYIYGCSTEERASKFKQIITELIKQKEEIENKKNRYTEQLQKLSKKEFAQKKEQAKTISDSLDKKIEKYTETIESIKEKYKDKWVPAPEFCLLQEEDKVEKINKDIPENTMRIHIGKTDYDKDNVYLKVHFKTSDKELTKDVQLKGNQDFNETWDWTFEKNEYKHLDRNCLLIDMEKSYWYKFGGSNVKGSLKIELKELKNNIQLAGDYKMELVSKRTTPSINISINLRTPFCEKQYETVTKEVLSVKKIYPPFNPKSAKVPGMKK